MSYAFTTKNGFCPSCTAFGKIWFIKDRLIGGNDYEYCLMSKPIIKPVQQKFKDKKGIAKWINDDTREKEYSDETAEYIVSRQINRRYNFSDKAIIEKNGESYIYDKVKHTITAVVEPKKETGWFDSYHECLKIAKEILANMECQQLTLDFK